MTIKSASYLSRARAYAATAALAEDSGRRVALLQIAQHWRDLADIVEKHSASRPDFDNAPDNAPDKKRDAGGASAGRSPTPAKPDR
jgi:hypothetical protein